MATTPPRRRHLSPKARRALELLASDPLGATEEFMLAHGFKVTILVNLVGAGLATSRHEVVTADGTTVAVDRLAITGAGRRALEG
jgi:hypothetical protein